MSEDRTPPRTPAEPPVSGRRRLVRKERVEFYGDTVARGGLRYVVLPVVILVALGIVASLIARPAYRWAKVRRGESTALQAMAEFQRGHSGSASVLLRSALNLAPGNTVVFRNAAQILSTENNPEALNFWEQIFLKGEGIADDRVRYVALALRLRRIASAKSVLEPLFKVEPNNPLVIRLMMEFEEAMGDQAGAISQARKLVELDGNATNRFAFAQTLVRASRPMMADGQVTGEQVTWAEEGSRILLPMAMNPGPLQSSAAATLADCVTLQGDAARKVVEALASKSPRSPADMISSAVIESKAGLKKIEEISERMIQELGSADLIHRLRAADWLAAVGRPDLGERLIRPADSSTNLLALHLELDLAWQNKNWPRIKKVLEQPPSGLSSSMTDVLTAAVAVSEDHAPRAEKLLHAAIDAAKLLSSADAELLYLGRSAERMGLLQVAIVAHESRLGRSLVAMDSVEAIFRLTAEEQSRDPQFPGLSHRFSALQARYAALPENPGIASEYFYVAAILGRDLPQVEAGLTRHRQQFPERPEPILGLAAIALRKGDTAEAARLIDENPIEYSSLPLRLKPLMVHILGQIGQREFARLCAQKLDPSQYYYEERELLTPWLPR